jgi:hypothetical protein
MCAAVAPPRPWKIQLDSSGGFAGRGNGSYTIDSGGTVTVTDMAGKSCTYELTKEELARIEKLLVKAKPKAWSASYMPKNPCCDRFEWTLTLTAGERTYKTQWLDREPKPPAPKDLIALVREAMAQRCRTGNT